MELLSCFSMLIPILPKFSLMVNQRINELLSGSCFTRGFWTISAWAMSMPMVLQEEGRKMTWWILTQDSPIKSFAKQSIRFYALSLLYGSRFTHLRHQKISARVPGTDVPNSSSCQALPSGLNSSPSSMTTATVTPVSQAAVKAAPVTPATHVTPGTAAPVTPGQGVKRSRSNEKGGKSGDTAATWTGRREWTRESWLDAQVLIGLYRFECVHTHTLCYRTYFR